MSKSLTEWKKDYTDATTKASDISRNMALAGIAAIWVFKNTDNQPIIPDALVFPLLLLVIALLLDFTQYFIKGWIWYIFFKIYERKVKKGTAIEHDIEAPEILPGIINIFYLVKFIPLVWAYIRIILYFYSKEIALPSGTLGPFHHYLMN